MSTSTSLVSGLSSGFDWRSVVDQLIAIDNKKVDLLEEQKTEYESKLSAWQSFNTKLLAFKTAAGTIMDTDDFFLYTSSMVSDSSTIDVEDLLSVSTDTDAAPGTYTIKVTNLAQAQKISSNPFNSTSTALGGSYAGDMVINGKVLTISETDTLSNIANNINSLNTGTDPSGVTASIVNYGINDYRLILTSDSTGEEGISLLNGSSANLVQKFGWKDNHAAIVKNSITGGAQSDRYSAQNVAIKTLMSLTTGEASTGTLTIDGTAVTIDLASQSLTDIKTAINDAMTSAGKGSQIVASVVSETFDDTTYYRLQIEGTQTFTDENNILNTLGILDHTSTDVTGKISGNKMTSDGASITSATLLTDIDGYISYTGSDVIQLAGLKTDGVTAVNYSFAITETSTFDDLLTAIENQYAASEGDVIAYVTSDGKIRVDDISGSGVLSVELADNITNGTLEFVDSDAAFGDASARKREIIAGEDATVLIDGVEVSSSNNTISDVIRGVTISLLKEEISTTVTLSVKRDIPAIKSKIEDFVTKYNDVMSYINTQSDYHEDTQKTGGILFGDGTLSSVKSDITSLLTQNIWGVNNDFSVLSLVGITMDNDLLLTVDDSKLNGYLETNFNDIMSLFAGQGSVSNSNLIYLDHSQETEAGEYTVHISRAATQGTETGDTDLSAGGADETLTITKGSSTAQISITNTMTITDIVHAINSELDSEYTQTIVGDKSVYADALQSNAISAETAWNNIYDNLGNQIVFEDNDVITFSGTNRKGSEISGSYTINSATTDSVQGLLSAIETAFTSSVTASVSTDGKIIITDKFSGTSQVAMNFIKGPDDQEFFGSVDITEGAEDGSQEGRYAIAVTASDDGTGKLVLQNDDYGSTSFTISQDITDGNYDHIIYSETSNTTTESSGTVAIDSTTTWDNVFGANAVNNDTVTISGKKHDGTDFSTDYTYTITDISSDTVGDLLSAIESAFSSEGSSVNAYIRDGRIYIEDQTSGSSSIELALTCNNEDGGSLAFGILDQTTQRDLDLGFINGNVNGFDVAGTINGEAATGSGQTLTGNNDEANIEGLIIKYTGSANNTDVGTVKVTLGIAELFDRTLFNITDPYEGYVGFKKDSLQNSIDTYETKIEDMEAFLDRKMEAMINQFVAMELALSKIQNQSDWLTGQLNAAFYAWE